MLGMTSPGGAVLRVGLCLSLLGALIVLLAGPAFAHAGEENVPAITDVQEAIAILATQPQLMDNALDKVHDATDSKETLGVNIVLACAALQACLRIRIGSHNLSF